MVVILVLCIGCVLTLAWSIRFQRRALAVIRGSESGRAVGATGGSGGHRPKGGVLLLEQVAPPLATGDCRLRSALLLDEVALVGCESRGAPHTLVMLLGSDGRAEAAHALLDAWQDAGADVRVTAFGSEGVQLQDGRGNTIRAPLLTS